MRDQRLDTHNAVLDQLQGGAEVVWREVMTARHTQLAMQLQPREGERGAWVGGQGAAFRRLGVREEPPSRVGDAASAQVG